MLRCTFYRPIPSGWRLIWTEFRNHIPIRAAAQDKIKKYLSFRFSPGQTNYCRTPLMCELWPAGCWVFLVWSGIGHHLIIGLCFHLSPFGEPTGQPGSTAMARTREPAGNSLIKASTGQSGRHRIGLQARLGRSGIKNKTCCVTTGVYSPLKQWSKPPR